MKNRTHLLLGVLVFFLSCLYLLPFINLYQGGDEGYWLSGAQRMRRGEIIYRDFYHFVAPGGFVFLSLLFKFFGQHFLVVRIATLLNSAFLALLTYLLAEKLLKNRYLALLPPFMLLVAGFPDWFLYSHHWLSSLLALTAVYLMVRGEEFTGLPEAKRPGWQEKGRWLYVLSGLFAALTLIFLQSKGLLLILALLAYLRFFSSTRPVNLLAYLIGNTLGLGMLVVYLINAGTLKSFFHYTFLWPFTNYIDANAVPYFNLGKDFLWRSFELQKQALLNLTPSNILSFIFYSSESLFLVTLGYLSILAIPPALFWGWKIKRKASASTEGSLLGLYSLTALAFFLSAWHRPDIIHLIFGASFPLILFFFFLQKGITATRLFPKVEKPRGLRSLGGFALVLVIILLGINTLSRAEDNLLKRFRRTYYPIENPKGRLWTDAATFAQDYNLLIPYLKAHLSPREPFVVIYNEPIIYYFLDAYNPLDTDSFAPEHINEKQLNHTLEAIKQKQIKYILKDRFVERIFSEKEVSIYPPAVFEAYKKDPVSRYLQENYRPVLILNNFTLYQRKN